MGCAVSAEFAAYERAQDRQQESDTVLAAIREAVASNALRAITADKAKWEQYFTAYCEIENLPESSRDLIADTVRLMHQGFENTPLHMLRTAFADSVKAACERYTNDETKRLHDEWREQRG